MSTAQLKPSLDSQTINEPRWPRRTDTAHRGDGRWSLALLAPSIIGIGAFYIWPIIQTFIFSFSEWSGFGAYSWNGLDNYRQLLTDTELLRAIRNTLLLTVLSLLGIPISVVVASLLARSGLRGLTFYRVIYFLPVVAPPAAISLMWEFLYDGDYGMVNWILSHFGVPPIYWLADKSVAIFAVAAVAVWSGIGFNIIILLAGIQGIPREYYEAAALDGASKTAQFRFITTPLLTPSIFFVTVIGVIGSLQTFDFIYLMIGKSNPALKDTQTVVYLFYKSAFEDYNGGYASAIAFLLLAMISIITFIQFKLQKRWVYYD